MERAVTKKQGMVLKFIKDFVRETGYPPTVREIARHLGLTGPKSVQKHLAALEKKGRIKRVPKKPRAIQLADGGAGIPIVGTVAAGKPVLSEENVEGTFSLGAGGGNEFFVRVKGDSMIEAHIAEGDLVLVRPQPTAENGDIVVAMHDGEITLKRFYKEGQNIVLRPENRSMPPITVEGGDLKIIGKAVMVVRKF